MIVIPAINAPDLDGVLAIFHRLEKFLPAGSTVHLDVCDAQFTANRTWGDPATWKSLVSHLKVKDLQLEAHLMVQNPEEVVEPWLRAGARRVIVHVEAMTDGASIRRACEGYEAQPMLALNPETSVERLKSYLRVWTAFQTLAVHPGLAGQRFLPIVLEKIKFIRAASPHAIIEVDGGINLEMAMLVKAHGADTIISASYVLESPDPSAAFRELEKV